MFCSKCGSPVTEGARFCGRCGNPLENILPEPVSNTLIPIIAPCYIFDGLITNHPAVMWMDQRQCAFLNIGSSLLDQIVQATPPPPKRVSRSKQIALAFHPYAEHLREYSLEDLLQRFPNSIVVDTNKIMSFSCLQEYDSDRHEFYPNIRFTLKTDTEKHKGMFERDTPFYLKEPGLRLCIQNRYSYRERSI